MNPEEKTKKMGQLQEWLGDPNAELCEELQNFRHKLNDMTVIRHPLFYSVPHMEPMMNDLANRALKQKQEHVARARQERNWTSYLMLHERPYRLMAFHAIADVLSDGDYWSHLGFLWIDTENYRELADQWEEAFSSERPGRENLMDDDERAFLADLPESFTIYRGFHFMVDGLSWTLDRDRAEWFARRLTRSDDTPRVATGTVARENVLAYFSGRNEEEIVVFLENVEIESTVDV